jgi:hypothetical protein
MDKKELEEIGARLCGAAMVSADVSQSLLDEVLDLRDRIEQVRKVMRGCIIVDTNGQYCRMCDGQDQDLEGVIHHGWCVVGELEKLPIKLK